MTATLKECSCCRSAFVGHPHQAWCPGCRHDLQALRHKFPDSRVDIRDGSFSFYQRLNKALARITPLTEDQKEIVFQDNLEQEYSGGVDWEPEDVTDGTETD